jgi:hypothetical protein
MRILFALLATLSLVICVWAPLQFFWGGLTEAGYKTILLAASLAYFAFATLWAARSPKAQPRD